VVGVSGRGTDDDVLLLKTVPSFLADGGQGKPRHAGY
jgi:hypothetical protein